MRVLGAAATVLALVACATAQPQPGKDQGKPLTRFGVEANFEKYPQKSPQEALKSALRSLEEKQIDYLIAFLADPEFVQARLKGYRAELSPALSEANQDALAFQRLVKVTAEHFRDDPTKFRELYRFSREGEWETGEELASAAVAAVPTRKVFLRKIQDYWYLMDRDK